MRTVYYLHRFFSKNEYSLITHSLNKFYFDVCPLKEKHFD